MHLLLPFILQRLTPRQNKRGTGRKYFLLFLVLLAQPPAPLPGQYFTTGEDPASLRWEQFSTTHFRLIYPAGFRENAFRMADILEYYRENVSRPLGHDPGKIPVILHNHTAESNGLVAWAPKRIEMFTTPPQNIYPHDWLQQLALHEYRHVVQVDKLNQGFTRVLSYLGGEQVPGAVTSMLGDWFLEGDAVYAETRFSPSGRGRLPSYEMQLRTRALAEERFYRFDEVLLGSYKTHVPDYYAYGYQMVAYARTHYGDTLWQKAIENTGKYPFLLNPVHFTLRRAGLSKRKLFDSTFNELEKRWKEQYLQETYTSTETVSSPPGKWFTSYRFPQPVSGNLILAEKSGIDQVDQFVLMDSDGKEQIIHTPGHTSSVRLSAKKNLVAWAEYIPDIRWENQRYSVIKTYDLKTGKTNRLSSRSRLFAPAVSPDAGKIAAVEVNPQNRVALVILDARTGERLDSIPSPGNRFLMLPEWTENDRDLLVISLDHRGKGISRVNTSSGRWTEVLAPSYHDILLAASYRQYILYHSSYSGIDNIYALDTLTRQIYRVTSSRFGAFDPAVDTKAGMLYYSDYHSQGHRIVKIPLEPSVWEELDSVENRFRGFISDAEEAVPEPVPGDLPSGKYEPRPYRKGWNLFRFHSWMPFYFDLENFTLEEPDIAPGATLLSQNLLNTAFTSLAYAYREGDHHFTTGFTYRGWFPVIRLEYRQGGEIDLLKPQNVEYRGSITAPARTFTANISLPLNLTRNRFYSALVPSLQLTAYNDIYFNLSSRLFEQNLLSSRTRLYYYFLHKTSPRDLYPKWGGILDLIHLSVPGKAESFNPSFKLKAALFLPGLFNHHGLRLEGSYQTQNLDRYAFTAGKEFPRGYDPVFSETLESFRSDYVFPLWYPDLSIPGVLYIKRMSGGLFGDAARNRYREWNEEISSYVEIREPLYSFGGSLTFDFHVLRIPWGIRAGARFAWLPLLNKPVIESIFSVDIYGFSINRR
ncbi:MAG: hypothetical protein ACP5D1_02290 [Bacteroidales bacterium]